MKKIISTNPAKNYEVIGEVTVSNLNEIKKKVEGENNAKKLWKELGIEKRIALLTPLLDQIEERKEELAYLITKEMGKPINESRDDISWDLGYLKSFFKLGEEYLKDEITHSQGNSLHRIIFEPIGSAAVITPWNFPFDMFLWGNT